MAISGVHAFILSLVGARKPILFGGLPHQVRAAVQFLQRSLGEVPLAVHYMYMFKPCTSARPYTRVMHQLALCTVTAVPFNVCTHCLFKGQRLHT